MTDPSKHVLLLPGPRSVEAAQNVLGDAYEYQSYLSADYTVDGAAFLANGHLLPLAGRKVDLWEIPQRFGASHIAAEPIVRQLLKLQCQVRVIVVAPTDEQYEPFACKAIGMSRDELLAWARARIKVIDPIQVTEAQPAKRGRPRGNRNGEPTRGELIVDTGGIEAQKSVFVSWEELGLTSFDGKPPHPNLDNLQKILSRHPALAGQIWFDEFHGKVFQTLFNDEPTEWADHHDTRMTIWIQRTLRLPKIGHQLVQRAVDDYARMFPRNEVREWMDGLAWDRTERLPTLMHDGWGANQNDYTAAVGRCWMMSMAARTYEPGCSVHYMPVFEGSQGRGKTTALSIIGGKWYSEVHENIMSKDFLQVLPGNLLIEVAEIHSFNKADIEKVKGIVSCPSDRYRASYGRRAENHPRRGVWAGTTNRDDWNRDETGARRFWPILCHSINLEYLRRYRDQLFAEAIYRYRMGEPWWDIDPKLAKIEQDARREEDSWTEIVMGYVQGRKYAFVRDLLCGPLDFKINAIQRRDEQRVGSILRIAGWTKVQMRLAGENCRVWVPPTEASGEK